jgi:hypothetical protein
LSCFVVCLVVSIQLAPNRTQNADWKIVLEDFEAALGLHKLKTAMRLRSSIIVSGKVGAGPSRPQAPTGIAARNQQRIARGYAADMPSRLQIV